MPVLHNLDDYIFAVSFEIKKCEFSNLFFFFNTVLTFLSTLQLHKNFLISSSISK